MRRRNGFSLIELLVVIAIIGILAAIIFPVYAQAKKSAYKSSDLSSMNSLRSALQLYRADNGAFPPALLGYVGQYANVSGGNILPPNSIRDALYPRRVESLSVFRPALDRIPDNLPGHPFTSYAYANDPLVTNAVWPGVANTYSYKVDGTMTKQRYNAADLVHRTEINPTDGSCRIVPSVYYKVSGYDVAPASNAAGAPMESHYQLFWTAYAVPSGLGGPKTDPVDGCGSATADGTGSGADSPRQLGYTEPPETTVVTWNPFFRDYTNGAPLHQKQDLVLFLGGNARPMDSANVASQAWAVLP